MRHSNKVISENICFLVFFLKLRRCCPRKYSRDEVKFWRKTEAGGQEQLADTGRLIYTTLTLQLFDIYQSAA